MKNELPSFDTSFYKRCIKIVEGMIAEKEGYKEYNKNTFFLMKETAAYLSIIEFGNEKAKRLAMQTLEHWWFTGKTKFGWSKIRTNYNWDDLIEEALLKTMAKANPVQGELFVEEQRE